MSQVVHETTLQGVRPFFGCNDDVRGEFFTHLNYLGSEFSVAINNGNVPMIESQPVFQLLLCQNYTNCGANEAFYLHEDMVDLVANTAAFHKIIDTDAKGSASNSSPFVKYLYDSVYRGWDNLTLDVRKFYSTHLHVLVKGPDGTSWVQPANVAAAASLDAANVRLNLTKVNKADSSSGILFAETLPKLTKLVQGFRVTIGTSVISVPCAGGCPEDLLKQIYNSVYSSGSVTAAGNTLGAFAYINCDIPPRRKFNLDAVKFSKNVILAHAQGVSPKQTAAANAAAGRDNFDDIFTSLTTGVTFMRDGDGKLFRIDGSTKTEMNHAQLELDLDPKNGCHGTKISGDCDVVFQCLLSGNPSNLSRCLGKLKNENMFKVAQREVELMNPQVATQLLKTFGFTPRKELPHGLVLPPSFDEWRQNILPNSVNTETQQAIVDNAQLMNYLKGVVSLIRNNPTVLEENKNSSQYKMSDYATRAGIQVFVPPKSTGERAQVVANILEQGVLLSRPTVNTMPLAGLFNNIGMTNNMMNASLILQGGGAKPNCPNANMLKNMFDVTYSEMERNGKVLVDADKKRIDDSVKRVAHLEEQLVRILEDLKLFTKLNTTFSLGRGPIGVDEVSLTEVVGATQASSVTGEAIGNLKNCASQNITEQSKLMSDMVLQIQKSLVGTMTGGKNPLLERVYSGRM
jgi:hypothetical protein